MLSARSKGSQGSRTTSKARWRDAYRSMRVLFTSLDPRTESTLQQICRLDLVYYLAYMVLRQRNHPDPLLSSPAANLLARQLIREILAEEEQCRLQRALSKSDRFT